MTKPAQSRADSVVRSTDKKLYFGEPHIETMTMKELLSSLGQDGSSNDDFFFCILVVGEPFLS
jgi:hypothetical protein